MNLFGKKKEKTKVAPACACNGTAVDMEAVSMATGCSCDSDEKVVSMGKVWNAHMWENCSTSWDSKGGVL